MAPKDDAAPAPCARARACACACACSGLFVDEDFPARWNVLPNAKVHAAWLRPHEISKEPRLFVEGCSRFAVNQGSLGDCWFMAACAAVAEHEDLLKQVVPAGQTLFGPGYDGAVRFRLWHLGEWTEVRVDDRLPVDARGRPVYARCQHPDEFWLPLLEKAFAKFQGSYGFLHKSYGNSLSEGLINLTGYCLNTTSTQKWEPTHNFSTLQIASACEAMTVCKTESFAPGLPGSHVYTITKVFHRPLDEKECKEGEEEMKMVRVRNPWGTGVEWTGAWKIGDERWNKLSSEIKDEMQYTSDNDGEFWMDAQDFCENFTQICYATQKPIEAMEMEVVGQITGHWSDDREAGGNPDDIQKFAKNPQFLLVALGAIDPENEDTKNGKGNKKNDENEEDKEKEEKLFNPMVGMEAVIELLQEHNRKKRTWQYEISYFIFETCAERRLSAEQMLDMTYVSGATGFKEATGVRSTVLLQPGRRYVVVPTTRAAGDDGDFLLRVFSRRARVRLTQLRD